MATIPVPELFKPDTVQLCRYRDGIVSFRMIGPDVHHTPAKGESKRLAQLEFHSGGWLYRVHKMDWVKENF